MATLEKIRKRSVLLLIVIAVALLAFIVGDALTNSRQIFGNGSTVAQIGGKKIDITEYQAKLQQLNAQIEQQRSANPDAPTPDHQMVAQEALNQLIQEALLDEAVDKMNIQVGGDMLRYYMIENPINQNIGTLIQAMQASGIPVQSPQQAWTAIFQPQTVGKTTDDMAAFRAQWMSLENETRKLIARYTYTNLLGRTVQANALDKQRLAADYNTAVTTQYAFKPYGNLDAKQFPLTDAELKAAYEELKGGYRVEFPSKSVALIRVEVSPSQADVKASQALAQKVKGELRPGSTLSKVTKKEGVAMERHNLRAADITDQKVKDFVAHAPKDSLFVVTNDVTGFQIIRMGDRTLEVDSIQINTVAVAPGTLPKRVLAALNGGLSLDSINNVFKQDSVMVAAQEQWIPLYTAAGKTDMDQAMLDSLYKGEGRYVVMQDNGQGVLLGKLVKKNAPVEVYSYDEITYRLKPSNNTMADAQQKLGNFLAKNKTADQFVKNAPKAGYTLSNYDLSQFSAAIPEFEGGGSYLPDTRQVVRWVMIDGDKGDVSQIYESKDLQHPQLYAVAVTDEFEDYLPITHRRVSKEVEQYARNRKAGEAWVKQYSGKGNVAQTAQAMGVMPTTAIVHFNPFNNGGINDAEVLGTIVGSKKGQVKVVPGKQGVYVFQVDGVTVENNPFDDQMYTQQYQGFLNPNMQKMLQGNRKVKVNIYKFEAGN